MVFVPVEGGYQRGVRTEALSSDLISVSIPVAPNPHSGSVFFFSADNVRPAGAKMAAALNCLRRCGAQRALAANARLRETFPQGFAFDGTHHPHLTLVQRSWPPTTFQGERPARSFSARLFNRARHPLRPPQAGDQTRGARGIR